MPDFAALAAQLLPLDDLGVIAFAILLGGLVRGFTGFGFAMVFMPIASTVVSPVFALVIIWFVDAPFALYLGAGAWRKADTRSVGLLLLAVVFTFPIGIWLLTTLDAYVMRWVISALILMAVSALATGWRYHGKPGVPLTLGVGSMSGLFSGLASLGGMPLALFWLSSSQKTPQAMRADLQTYFGLTTFTSGAVLAFKGLLTLTAGLNALLLLPIYGIGLILGTRGFHLASETTFRRIAYLIIFLSAVLSLPLLDGVLR